MTGILNLLMGVGGALKDQYFNLVSLLLPGDGTNGAQNNTFLDSSSNNFTITRNGDTTQGTFSPFSQTGWGNYFNGSGSSQLAFPTGSFVFGNSDFTIEAWVYNTGTTTGTFFNNQYTSGASTTSIIGAIGSTNGNFDMYIGGSVYSLTGINPTSNQWVHVAIVRTGGTVSVFQNGTRTHTRSDLGTLSINAGGTAVAPQIGSSVLGYMSNYRIIIGSGGYDATGSTITVPTGPLSSTTNTKLLTCQANRFIDNNTATTAKTITVSGTPSVTPFSPFAPTSSYSAAAVGGSGYFDGSGDYISTTGGAAIAVGAGAFTLEGWVYFNGFSDGAGFGSCAVSGDASTDRGVSLLINSASTWRFRIGRSVAGQFEDFLGSTTLTTGQWYHFQLVRTSTGTNDTRMYLNGVLQGSAGTSTININMQKFSVGTYSPSDASGGLINGYVSGVRLTNTAVASGVPTSPPTAVSGTAILINFTNAGVVDATAKNVLETEGNAQISTAQSKWGGGSIYLNGSGNWLRLRDSDLFNPQTSDFTIEAWVYVTSLASAVTIYARESPTENGTLFLINSNGTLGINLATSSSTYGLVLTGGSVSTNAWTYVAAVRSGSGTNNIKLYINGSQVAQGTFSGSVYNSSSATPIVGARNTNGDLPFTGYIDDFRFTRYARTIATPTAPFPLQ
jgi:hypothetical protein